MEASKYHTEFCTENDMPRKHKSFSVAVYDSGLVSTHVKSISKALSCEILTKNQSNTYADVVLFPFPHPSMNSDVELMKKKGLFTVAYWIGSDAYKASHDYFYNKQLPVFDLHTVCHPRLRQYLDQLSILSEDMLLFSDDKLASSETERKNTIGVYLPHLKYNYFVTETLKIMTECPEYGFLVYGGVDIELPKNGQNLGRLTQQEVLALMSEIKGSIRLTRYDGFPVSIIQTKKESRNVISTYAYEGCHEVQNISQAVNLIKNGLFESEDDSPWPSWYKKNCSPFAFKTRLFDLVSEHANLPR